MLLRLGVGRFRNDTIAHVVVHVGRMPGRRTVAVEHVPDGLRQHRRLYFRHDRRRLHDPPLFELFVQIFRQIRTRLADLHHLQYYGLVQRTTGRRQLRLALHQQQFQQFVL